MLKTRTKIFLFLLCGLLLIGCSKGDEANKDNESYYRFVDDAEFEIVLNEKPKKVAVLFSSFAEVWTISGGEIAITVQESVDRGFASSEVLLVDGGAGKTINHELLIEAQPDLVICSLDIEAQKETADLLHDVGIPAACFHVETFDDYLRMLKICTEITENKEAYNQYGTEIETSIEELLGKIDTTKEKEKILFIRCGSSASSTKAKQAKDHFAAAMLNEINTYNIAENAPILLDGLSIEEILIEDPNFIFVSTMGNEEAAKEYFNSVLQDPTWQSLSAVKNEHVIYLPKDLFQFKPNQRWDEAYRMLIELVYGSKE